MLGSLWLKASMQAIVLCCPLTLKYLELLILERTTHVSFFSILLFFSNFFNNFFMFVQFLSISCGSVKTIKKFETKRHRSNIEVFNQHGAVTSDRATSVAHFINRKNANDHNPLMRSLKFCVYRKSVIENYDNRGKFIRGVLNSFSFSVS